jgi:hypothetical protein
MSVNEIDRDWLRMNHQVDVMESIINGIKMENEDAATKKKQVGNMVMALEEELLDSRWTEAGKDVESLSDRIAVCRTYWKSTG